MRRLAPVLALLALASAATPSWGQEQEELSLAIRRDFGLHSLQAVGATASGVSVRSPARNVQFVSADEGWAAGVGGGRRVGVGCAAAGPGGEPSPDPSPPGRRHGRIVLRFRVGGRGAATAAIDRGFKAPGLRGA